MPLTGKVTEFNRSTGIGSIISKEAGGKVRFHTAQVAGGHGKLDAGDFVQFEMALSDGECQVTSVVVISRALALQQRAEKAQASTAVNGQASAREHRKPLKPSSNPTFTCAALSSIWGAPAPEPIPAPLES